MKKNGYMLTDVLVAITIISICMILVITINSASSRMLKNTDESIELLDEIKNKIISPEYDSTIYNIEIIDEEAITIGDKTIILSSVRVINNNKIKEYKILQK